MNTNYLDVSLCKTKRRCCISFLLFLVFFLSKVYGMFSCSSAVVNYANSIDYIHLFDHDAISSFFLGRVLYLAMEFLFAGKGIIWVFFKSLTVSDVLLIMICVMIFFQDSISSCASRLRIYTFILMISFVLIVCVYSLFLVAASVQLTTDAGFFYLRSGGIYGQCASFGLAACSILFGVMMLLRKE